MTSRHTRPDDATPVFVISVAAQLAGMHAQTLRQYDRLGLVTPSRTRGGGRRYSARDIAQLREVQRLSQEEGVSLAGIQRILDLENHVAALRDRLAELRPKSRPCAPPAPASLPPGQAATSSRCAPASARLAERVHAGARGVAALAAADGRPFGHAARVGFVRLA